MKHIKTPALHFLGAMLLVALLAWASTGRAEPAEEPFAETIEQVVTPDVHDVGEALNPPEAVGAAPNSEAPIQPQEQAAMTAPTPTQTVRAESNLELKPARRLIPPSAAQPEISDVVLDPKRAPGLVIDKAATEDHAHRFDNTHPAAGVVPAQSTIDQTILEPERPSTVQLHLWQFIALATGALLLGSMITATGMTAGRRRQFDASPQGVKGGARSPLNLGASPPDDQHEEVPPVDLPRKQDVTAIPSASTRVSVETLIKVARKWTETASPDESLFSAVELPGRLDTLHGTTAGMVSITGPVRRRNEDACLLLNLANGSTLLMSADGMGGHSDGHLASRLALVGACLGIREALQHPKYASSEQVLHHAFTRSKWLLRQACRTENIKRDAGTTLILTMVEANDYVTAYLGDGGAFVRRADGSLVALMNPQKSESTVLERYLAADAPLRWRPELTRVQRSQADVLAIGSDGVMDRVDIGEVLGWLASNVATKGLSMTKALRQLVEHFSTLQRRDGSPVADDNMTLVAVRMK